MKIPSGIKHNRPSTTPEQHREIGERLRLMVDVMRLLRIEFMPTHFTQSSPARKRPRRVIEDLLQMRHEFDQLAGVDVPREELIAQEPYFPGPATDLDDFRRVLKSRVR